MDKKIGVVGLGYVGLPLAVEFGRHLDTVGFDLNAERIKELEAHNDVTNEVFTEDFKDSVKLSFTSDIQGLKDCNYIICAVPTPIDKNNRPDLSPIENSTKDIAKILNKGDIVIYESTVYPGVTEDICAPILEKESGLIYNTDFFLGYSPERINPGDREHTLTTIVKITSGSTPETADRVDELYNVIVKAGTHRAPSIKVAEAAKVIENTQRDTNIAIVNELALIFDNMGIDTRDVLEAAGTKWNFLKFQPGLVGGHCIGVDPYYLTFRAEELGYRPNLILAARVLNNSIGRFIAEKTIRLMIDNDKKIRNARVLVLGVTFKENCPDTRNTKVTDVIEELIKYGIEVDAYDPWVDPDEKRKNFPHKLISDPFKADIKYDAVILTVAHDQFKALKTADYEAISEGKMVLIDVKGVAENPSWRL